MSDDHDKNNNFTICECVVNKEFLIWAIILQLVFAHGFVVRKSKLTNKIMNSYFSKTPTINKNVWPNEIGSVAVASISESTTSLHNTDIGSKGRNLVSRNQRLPLLLNPKVLNNDQLYQTKLPLVSNNESQQDNFSNFHCDINRLLVKLFGAHTYEDRMGIVLLMVSFNQLFGFIYGLKTKYEISQLHIQA